MLTCKPIATQPCIQYELENPAALVEFVLLNGGTMPRFQANGTAELFSLKNDEPRGIYLKPGSWLRCLKPGSFYADSDEVFRATYQINTTLEEKLTEIINHMDEQKLEALFLAALGVRRKKTAPQDTLIFTTPNESL